MNDSLEAHLIQLELRLQTSSTRGDAAALEDLLCADFREFGASGRIWDRTGILAQLTSETPYEIASSDFQCMRLSSDLALLTYVAQTRERSTLRSSLWRCESGHWRMLFHQGTVIE